MALWQSRTEQSENGRTINDREHNGPANGAIGRNKPVKGTPRRERKKKTGLKRTWGQQETAF